MNSPAAARTKPRLMMTTNNSLAEQLRRIGLCAVPAELDDFLARATKARWFPTSPRKSDPGRNGRAFAPQSGAPAAPQRRQELQAHG